MCRSHTQSSVSMWHRPQQGWLSYTRYSVVCTQHGSQRLTLQYISCTGENTTVLANIFSVFLSWHMCAVSRLTQSPVWRGEGMAPRVRVADDGHDTGHTPHARLIRAGLFLVIGLTCNLRRLTIPQCADPICLLKCHFSSLLHHVHMFRKRLHLQS